MMDGMKGQSNKLKEHFSARGYFHALIENQMNKVIYWSKQDIRKVKPKEKRFFFFHMFFFFNGKSSLVGYLILDSSLW